MAIMSDAIKNHLIGFPSELHRKIKERATATRRSFTSEVIYTMENSFRSDPYEQQIVHAVHAMNAGKEGQ